MRAVVLEVSPDELARRRRTGVDRWDEMWEGVLHKAPAPAYEHQRIVDYRIPDLTLVATGRESLIAPDGVRGPRTRTEI